MNRLSTTRVHVEIKLECIADAKMFNDRTPTGIIPIEALYDSHLGVLSANVSCYLILYEISNVATLALSQTIGSNWNSQLESVVASICGNSH